MRTTREPHAPSWIAPRGWEPQKRRMQWGCMKARKPYPCRASATAKEEHALARALRIAELRILLGVLTPEQFADVAPRLRTIYEEFSQ